MPKMVYYSEKSSERGRGSYRKKPERKGKKKKRGRKMNTAGTGNEFNMKRPIRQQLPGGKIASGVINIKVKGQDEAE